MKNSPKLWMFLSISKLFGVKVGHKFFCKGPDPQGKLWCLKEVAHFMGWHCFICTGNEMTCSESGFCSWFNLFNECKFSSFFSIATFLLFWIPSFSETFALHQCITGSAVTSSCIDVYANITPWSIGICEGYVFDHISFTRFPPRYAM
jgi:hypothetical protein